MQGHSKMTSLPCPSDPHDDRRRGAGFNQTDLIKYILYKSYQLPVHMTYLSNGIFIGVHSTGRGGASAVPAVDDIVTPSDAEVRVIGMKFTACDKR